MPKEMNRRKMSATTLEMVSGRFRALGEPSRLKLLIALESGEKCVNALAEATGLTQANVSRHLHELTQCGILGRRKAGLQVFYHVTDPTIFEMCDHVCGSLINGITERAGAFEKGGSSQA
jgi:ArsR family transcriptional regulator